MCTREYLVAPGIACKPGCMARGRRKRRKVAAEGAVALNAGVAAAPAQSARISVSDGSSFRRSGATPSIPTRRPTPTPSAEPARPQPSPQWEQQKAQQADLRRLGDLSMSLVRLHREEAKLLRERDALIAKLRAQDVQWSSLSMRTGLSRQALSKRVTT